MASKTRPGGARSARRRPAPSRTTAPARRNGGDTYWIERKDQILCLASPQRQAIIDWLAAAGPASVREFAAHVGLAPSAAYHHLHQLEAVGLVRRDGTRVVRRKSEAVYATVAPRMRMIRALERPAGRNHAARVVSALCRRANRDFAAGAGDPEARPTGAGRNLGFFRMVAAPPPAALAEINRCLDRITELMWTQGDDRAPRMALAWTLSPVGRGLRRSARRPTTRRTSK